MPPRVATTAMQQGTDHNVEVLSNAIAAIDDTTAVLIDPGIEAGLDRLTLKDHNDPCPRAAAAPSSYRKTPTFRRVLP